MSIEAISWALNVPVGGNQKVMLIGLANHAHPDGTESYPSLDTLARYGRCDRSTARRNVRALVAAGWAIEDGEGPMGTHRYRLPLWLRDHEPQAPEREGGGKTPRVASAPEGGGTGVAGGVAPMPPEPSIEPSIEPSSSLAGARASEPPQPKPLSYRGKRVPAEVAAEVDRLLDVFAEVTGRSRRSQPARKQVAAALMARPEVDGAAWEAGIRAVVANPPDWWDGPPEVGHVFGERAADWTLRAATQPPQAPRAGRQVDVMDHYAAMHAEFLAEQEGAP